MNLSNHNRCRLILWALFISVISLLILAEFTFAQEKSLSGSSQGQEQIRDEQVLGSLEEQESQARIEKERLKKERQEKLARLKSEREEKLRLKEQERQERLKQAQLEKERLKKERLKKLAELKARQQQELQEKENLRKQKEEESARKKEEERKRLAEERQKKEAELEKKRQEAEQKKQAELAQKQEQLRARQEELARQKEEQLKKLAAEKQRKIEQARQAQLEAKAKEEERLKKLAELKARQQQELQEKENLRKQKEEESARKKEEESARSVMQEKAFTETMLKQQESQERLKQAPLEEARKLAPQEAELKLEAKEAEVKAKPKTEEEVESKRLLEEVTPEKRVAPQTVSLDFSDVPLGQILTTFASIADLDIVGGEALSEKISIHLKSVPIENVFDIILKSTPYTYTKEGKILRIIPKTEMPLVTEVFELRFVPAGQIKEALSHLITTKGNVKSFSKFSEGKYANFLIVTDTGESLEVIREIVKKLDKKLRQVMIEAKFCEVTLDKNLELGIDWVIKASLSGAKGPTTFPLGKTGKRILEKPETITSTSGSITLGTMSFADFTATLKALDTKTKVNLIASPHVAAMDGQEAEIVIGDKVPIPLYERNSETGTMEVTGYQEENIGVVLRLTPIINEDNTVTLKVHPEVSEITGYTGPNNERPIVSTRQITTVFIVEDGKTFVLGGLMKQTLRNTLKRVPILGSIPLFGRVFRYQDDSEDRTDLLIFITPHILGETAP